VGFLKFSRFEPGSFMLFRRGLDEFEVLLESWDAHCAHKGALESYFGDHVAVPEPSPRLPLGTALILLVIARAGRGARSAR
jgi:hypothetical protein